jgi:hypothetical protein
MSYFDRIKSMDEVVAKMEGQPKPLGGLSHVFKFNPNHDEQGRFASHGAASESYGAKAHGLMLQVAELSKKTESALSPILKEAVAGVPGAGFVGWEFRLKTEKSMERKIYMDAKAKKITMEEEAHRLGDAVRYTVTAAPKNYERVVKDTLKALEAKGYTVMPGRFRNSWVDPESRAPMYQGINLNMMAPTGQPWELQFHTPQSYKVKEHQNHPYYEEYRKSYEGKHDNRLTPERRGRKIRLETIMKDNQEKVRKPPGAHLIQWP